MLGGVTGGRGKANLSSLTGGKCCGVDLEGGGGSGGACWLGGGGGMLVAKGTS